MSRVIRGEVHDAASRFFRELEQQLVEYNRRTGRTIPPRGKAFGPKVQVSMSRLIGEALEIKAPDTAVAKMKQGIYTPSNEKIELIAKKLRIPPTTFTDYVVRHIQEEAKHDPDIMNMFRVLSGMGRQERSRELRRFISEKAS